MESISQLLAHLALDLVAVSVLTFAVYYPRHGRRDLLPAYIALNVSLFAVVAALAHMGGDGGTALGFGLFGVLSIVRLRSESIQNEEVAYYFATLVTGLIAGLPHLSFGLATTLCALLLVAVFVADHPRLLARSHRAVVTFDVAATGQEAVEAYIRDHLGEPLSWKVQEVDYVRDLSVVDVRYRTPRAGTESDRGSRRAGAVAAPGASDHAPADGTTTATATDDLKDAAV